MSESRVARAINLCERIESGKSRRAADDLVGRICDGIARDESADDTDRLLARCIRGAVNRSRYKDRLGEVPRN